MSVGNADYTYRVDHLRRTGAHVKFLSVEPLLGLIDELDLTGIDWVIVGGESGHGSRPMQYAWLKRLREICKEAGVAKIFKQTGEKLARAEGYKSRKGCDDSEWPKSWRVRQFPSLPVIP